MTKIKLRRSAKPIAVSARNSKPTMDYSHKKAAAKDALELFVNKLGGVVAAAEFLGVKKQHVQQWRQRGAMGRHSACLLDEVDAIREAGFTKEFFRPDVTAAEWVTLKSQVCLIKDREQRKKHLLSQQKRLTK